MTVETFFSPKGHPDTKTEESAAHHLHEKTVQNIFWKTLELILNDFRTFCFFVKFWHTKQRNHKIGKDFLSKFRFETINHEQKHAENAIIFVLEW